MNLRCKRRGTRPLLAEVMDDVLDRLALGQLGCALGADAAHDTIVGGQGAPRHGAEELDLDLDASSASSGDGVDQLGIFAQLAALGQALEWMDAPVAAADSEGVHLAISDLPQEGHVCAVCVEDPELAQLTRLGVEQDDLGVVLGGIKQLRECAKVGGVDRGRNHGVDDGFHGVFSFVCPPSFGGVR